jgi:folate-binding protein YgfZ
MEPAHLSDRAVIALEGPEARDFLQGLVTADITTLQPGRGLYTALLTPQGKILFDFFVTEGDGALLLDCRKADAPALARRLGMYRLRAKIEIAPRPQLGVYVGLSGRPAVRAVSFPDPRLAALGPRAIGAIAEMPDFLPDASLYHTARLALGVPEGADFGSDKVFALDAGLEELHGVSFTKGCYIGQELTSRMKHRGTARKRILAVRSDAALPAAGTVLTADGGEIGEILSSYGATGFALVRLDRLDAVKEQITAADICVTLSRPAWLG